MRTVVVRLRRQPRRVTKRCTELYETAQPRSESSSWMRVSWSRSEVTQRSICSAHGASSSSLGTSGSRGAVRLSVASATNCCSAGSGPSRLSPGPPPPPSRTAARSCATARSRSRCGAGCALPASAGMNLSDLDQSHPPVAHRPPSREGKRWWPYRPTGWSGGPRGVGQSPWIKWAKAPD